jgi:ABC-type oligopeptide transport system ATPase subunit
VQAEVPNLLDALRVRRGLTYLMVSHDLAVVTHLCSLLMVMRADRVVEQVESVDLAAHRVQADYTRALMQASLVPATRARSGRVPARSSDPAPATEPPQSAGRWAIASGGTACTA